MYGSNSKTSNTNYNAMKDGERRNRTGGNDEFSRPLSRTNNAAGASSGGKVSALNVLNGVAFLINVIFTYGIGVLGIGNLPNNNEVSQNYQTLVTPAGWAFSIWAVIFIMQFIFVVVQFLPKYCSAPLVVKGVKYWYISTCIFQAGWSVAFSNEAIALSFVLIFLIWVTLVGILVFQYRITSTFLEYFLLRFPFAIHCGWVTAATVLNANVLAVSEQIDVEDQIAAAVFSLAILFTAAFWTLWSIESPEYVVAIAISWANAGIAYELDNPMDEIVEKFSDVILTSLSRVTTWIYVSILILFALRIISKPLIKRSRRNIG